MSREGEQKRREEKSEEERGKRREEREDRERREGSGVLKIVMDEIEGKSRSKQGDVVKGGRDGEVFFLFFLLRPF